MSGFREEPDISFTNRMIRLWRKCREWQVFLGGERCHELQKMFCVRRRGSPGIYVWTPVGLQIASPVNVGMCKSLRNLVGPPRFELGTSCTPSKRASQAAPRPEVLIVRQTA